MIYLASNSPRRQALLAQLGLEFTVLSLPADLAVDERPQAGEQPLKTINRLAAEKARAGFAYIAHKDPNAVVIGGDTDVVSRDNQLLGKPQNPAHAAQMLEKLSDDWHFVYSAVCVVNAAQSYCATACTRVYLRRLTALEIKNYIHSQEPFDKAGGYAIQGLGAQFVERIEGSYSGVVGLPLYETAHVLKLAGIPLI